MKDDALNLSLFVTDKGVSFKTASGNIAPGCDNVGSGVTVPMIADGGKEVHDFAEVTRCAAKLKEVKPDEVQVTITANPGTPYSTIIKTMDALRTDGSQILFPEVYFGVAK